jgi:hypothetical protein
MLKRLRCVEVSFSLQSLFQRQLRQIAWPFALHLPPQNWFWQQGVDKFLVARPHDLEMETVRKKYFGDF